MQKMQTGGRTTRDERVNSAGLHLGQGTELSMELAEYLSQFHLARICFSFFPWINKSGVGTLTV